MLIPALEPVFAELKIRQACTLLGMRKSYATDLLDSEWAYLRDRLPELPRRVKTRTRSLRDIFDATFYVLKTGCQWRLLPHDFPTAGRRSSLPLPEV
jgi:hypothetical protein